MPTQQAMGKPVKRSDPEVTNRCPKQRFDATAHFCGRFVGKGHGQQTLWRNAFDVDQPGCTMHEHTRFATTSAGDNQHGFGGCSNGLTLSVVQRFEDRGDIHRGDKAAS